MRVLRVVPILLLFLLLSGGQVLFLTSWAYAGCCNCWHPVKPCYVCSCLLRAEAFVQEVTGATPSEFTGRDSLPAEPGGWIPSPLALSMSESETATLKEAGPSTTPSRGTEGTPLLSLRQIAPPGFLTQVFAVDSSGCAS